MRRYGSLININPSGFPHLFSPDFLADKKTEKRREKEKHKRGCALQLL